MIRTSKAPVKWPVPWDKSRAFYFRPGDVIERADFEAVLDGEYQAGNVFPFELAAAFAEGVNALLADSPDSAARIIAAYQADAALKAGESLPAKEKALLDEARPIIARSWPAYKALLAQEARRRQHASLLAFRTFCTGWEGKGLPPFESGPDGLVRLDILPKVPPLEIKLAGTFAFNLLWGRGQEKNSERPSSADRGPQTSSSTRRTAGGSRATSGRKTRSAPSPNGALA
jgi:hypothetical protein